jgi:soluble lytic murein transglycosylase-like protein
MMMTCVELLALTVGIAVRFEIPPERLTALIYAESQYNPLAISPAGCIGLGQINTAPGVWPVDGWIVPTDDPTEPYANLCQAAHIYSWLLSRYATKFPAEDHVALATAAYTMGAGAVDALVKKEGPSGWFAAVPEDVFDYVGFIALGEPSRRWGVWDLQSEWFFQEATNNARRTLLLR